MDKSILGNKLNAGFNTVKRMVGGNAETAPVKQAAATGKIAGDRFVGSAQSTVPAAAVGNNPALQAELALANVYKACVEKGDTSARAFAVEMARTSLDNLASSVG